MPDGLPTPVSDFTLTMEDGAAISVRQHGDPAKDVRLFVSHGNGFAIDGYVAFWGPLLDRFEVIAFDMRNHGRSGLSEPPNQNYAEMARDMDRIFHEVTERFGAKTSVGAFHSMSGRTAMKHAMEIGWVWDALVLFDPPDIPPEGHPVYEKMYKFEHRLAEWARARRHRFPDPSALAADYAASRAHQHWVPGAHAAMAQAVLREDTAAGDWALVFPGELEAQTYVANIPMNLWPKASDFGGPVLLIGADADMEYPSPTAPANKVMAEENGYRYAPIAGAGHMLQIEKPEACIEAMMAFLKDVGIVVG